MASQMEPQMSYCTYRPDCLCCQATTQTIVAGDVIAGTAGTQARLLLGLDFAAAGDLLVMSDGRRTLMRVIEAGPGQLLTIALPVETPVRRDARSQQRQASLVMRRKGR